MSLTLLLLLTLTALSSSDSTCKSSCGALPIHYPFGTGLGCGSPAFQTYVNCDPAGPVLTLTTRTGTYPIQSIDYTNQIIVVADPSMSTCSSTNPSAGFSLDWDAPFMLVDGDIFALLDCSNTTSDSSTSHPLCDTSNTPVCGLLYTCPAIVALGVPVSTCCVYAPASLGPSFEVDARKLGCTSYAAVYSFGAAERNPQGWRYGIALKYRFSVDDGYPSACANCEKSSGVCGYDAARYSEFVCSCGNGTNSSTHCNHGSAPMNGASRVLVLKFGFLLVSSWLSALWTVLHL